MRTQPGVARHALLSLCCLTSIVWASGCGQAAEGTPGAPGTSGIPGSTSKASSDARSTRPAPETPEASLIRLEPAELDLGGGHEAGKTVQGTVRLTNTSDRPVSITKTKASCGCTTAQAPEEPIEPGDSVELAVRLRISGKPGTTRRKFVWFYADGHDEPFTLTVLGRVADTVLIDFDDLTRPIDEDATIVLRSTDESPFSVTRVEPPVVRTVPTSKQQPRHEVIVSSSLWKQHGSPKRLTFTLDHPKFSTVDLEIPDARRARSRARTAATARSGSLSQAQESLSIHPRRLNVGLLDPASKLPTGDDSLESDGKAQSGVIREIVVRGIAGPVDGDKSCSPGISVDSPLVDVQAIDWRTVDDGLAIRIAVRQHEHSAKSTRQRTRVNVTCGERQGYFYLYFTPAFGSAATAKTPEVARVSAVPGALGQSAVLTPANQRTDSSLRTSGQGT